MRRYQRGAPGLTVARFKDGSTGQVVLLKPGADIHNLYLTDILGFVTFDKWPTGETRVQHSAAQRGYGTLVYDLAAIAAAEMFGASSLYPSEQLSSESAKFWRRAGGSIYPPSPAEFQAKFGYPLSSLYYPTLTYDDATWVSEKTGEFFRFTYYQDQYRGIPSIRPDEYERALTDKIMRVRHGGAKNLALLRPHSTQDKGRGRYRLVDPSHSGSLRAQDILARASARLSRTDGALYLLGYTGPPDLKALMFDTIAADARLKGIGRVVDKKGRIEIQPLRPLEFRRKYGMDALKMIERGIVLRRALLPASTGGDYPGTWFDEMLPRAFKSGTYERPVRLNQGRRTRT